MAIEDYYQYQVAKEDTDKKILSSLIEAAKSNMEITEKLTEILVGSLDKEKFKKMIVEESLKDPELRNRIALALIKKL